MNLKYFPPLSHAANGLLLMDEVRRLMLKYPKRVDMKDVAHVDATHGFVAGCISGWLLFMMGIYDRNDPFIVERVVDALGDDVFTEGFYGENPRDSISVFDPGYDIVPLPGTKAHAQAAIRRLDRFVKANRRALKARTFAVRLVPTDEVL